MAEFHLLDHIFVYQPKPRRHRGFVSAAGAVFPCALGRTGLVRQKREGDGGTPVGAWPLRYVLYRPDRLARPVSRLPVFAVALGDGWCDFPADRRYNRPIRLPSESSAEGLWRADGLYDVIVVLGYNDDPPVMGRGSAIFFHLAREDFGPTAGCVAVRKADMLKLVARCAPGTVMRIGA